MWQTIEKFQKLMHHNCWTCCFFSFQTFNVINIPLKLIFYGEENIPTSKLVNSRHKKDILRLIFCTRRNVETTKNLVNAALQVPKEINTQWLKCYKLCNKDTRVYYCHIEGNFKCNHSAFNTYTNQFFKFLTNHQIYKTCIYISKYWKRLMLHSQRILIFYRLCSGSQILHITEHKKEIIHE